MCQSSQAKRVSYILQRINSLKFKKSKVNILKCNSTYKSGQIWGILTCLVRKFMYLISLNHTKNSLNISFVKLFRIYLKENIEELLSTSLGLLHPTGLPPHCDLSTPLCWDRGGRAYNTFKQDQGFAITMYSLKQSRYIND